MHAQKAKTLVGATGTLIMLPMVLQAQTAGEAVSITSIGGVVSAQVLENGVVEVVLSNGQTVQLSAAEVTIGANGVISVSATAAQELAALSSGAGAAGGLAGVGGGAAAVGAGLLLAALGGGSGSAAEGGSGATSTSTTPTTPTTATTTVAKSLTIVDAPLENALVFYDGNGDGTPEETEYLGLTNAQGGIDVTYEPTANGVFIIIPSPVANPGDFGWSADFASQFDGIVTRDVVTDNAFTQILQANDTGEEGDQVVSPISTLVAAGVPAETVKEVLGLPADLDLDTFNFFEALESDDPAVVAAAKAASAAAIAAVAVVDAALAAAQASKTDGEALDAAEIAAFTSRAINTVKEVFTAAAEATEGGETLDLEDLAEVASAVAVADVLNDGNADFDAAALARKIVDSAVESAGTGGDLSTIDMGVVIADAVQELADEGAISAESVETVTKTSEAVATGTKTIKDEIDGTDFSDPAQKAAFEQALDEADDATDAAVNDVVNTTVLGLDLNQDIEEATEGQEDVIKGNVLENDLLTTGEGLGVNAVVSAVNGIAISDTVTPQSGSTIDTAEFFISTADGYSFWNSGRTVHNEVIENAIDLNAELPGSALTGFRATSGSVMYGQVEVTQEAIDAETASIDFGYWFGSADYVPWNDYSFFAVQKLDGSGNADGPGVVLRNEDPTYNPGDDGGPSDVANLKGYGYYTAAGQWIFEYNDFTYDFDEAGTYNFAFGVTDVGDTIFDTAVFVNGITLGNEDGGVVLVDQNGNTEADDIFTLGNAFGTYTSSDIDVPEAVSATLLTGFYGSLIIQQNGDYLYQVGGPNAEPIEEGEVVTDNFVYTVKTESGQLAKQTLQIKITGTAEEEGTPVVTLAVSDANAEGAGEYVVNGTLENIDPSAIAITISGTGGSDITLTGDDIDISEDGTSFTTTAQDVSGFDDGTLTVSATVTPASGDALFLQETVELDTTADAPAIVSFDFFSTSNGGQLLVKDLDDDAEAIVTLTVGETVLEVPVAGNGLILLDELNVGTATSVGINYVITDDVSNTTSGSTTVAVTQTFVTNTDTGAGFVTIAQAVEAAQDGETLVLASEHVFDEYVTIDKSLTIEGGNAGNLISKNPDDLSDDLDLTSSFVGGFNIAASDVRIDGVFFGLPDPAEGLVHAGPPLSWDTSVLSGDAGGLDNFALVNSFLVGYSAEQAPTFDSGLSPSDSTADLPSGWRFSGNLLGGLTEGNGGAMNLAGLEDLTVTDNVFWRPTAGHLYVESLKDSEISDNFFYHGVHSGGINLDGFLEDGQSGLGGDGGYGYGYGYGGTGDGVYFGRNFWVEMKGQNDGVTITGNDGQYNSGGIQLYGEQAGASFTDITISGNTFRDFVNADPNGLLGDGEAQSGFMGAVAVSVIEGSMAQGIVITDNTVTAALDQIYSENDQFALISAKGIVDGIQVQGNTLTFSEASSQTILDAVEATGAPASTYLVGDMPAAQTGVVAVALQGGISGAVGVTGNTFSEALAETDTSFVIGLYIEGGYDNPMYDDPMYDDLMYDEVMYDDLDGSFGVMTAVLTEAGNDFTGFAGLNAIPVLFDNPDPSFPIDAASIASPTAGLLNLGDLDDDGTDDFALAPITFGTSAGESLSGTGDLSVIVPKGGSDAIDAGAGSTFINIVLDPANAAPDTITNFDPTGLVFDTSGAPVFGGDILFESYAQGFELRGLDLQLVSPGDEIDDGVGIVVLNTDGAPSAADLASLTGLESGDTVMLLSQDGSNTVVTTFEGGEDRGTLQATIVGVDTEAMGYATFGFSEPEDMVVTSEV